jgi:hypothetical protein
MKRFLARLFSSEVDRLNAELAKAQLQRDWFQQIMVEQKAMIVKLEADGRKEKSRNQNREDMFHNQVLELTGGKALPVREQPQMVVQETIDLTPELSRSMKDQLEERATNYCQIQYGNFTPEQYKDTYDKMAADPESWLSN